MGFEQTNECYLTEVIPFFKTLKEYFEGIQKALTIEIKEMKDVFEELEDEVAQNVVHKKQDETKRKNLLIENNNLIVECLSKEVFSVAMNSELNIARFTEMHVAHTIVEARCLELEAEISNLCGKSHNDNHNELVNRFSNLEKEEAGIQLQAEEYDLMAAAADLNEIEEVNENCILMANLQQASTSSHYARNCTVRPRRRDAAYLQTQLLIAQKEEARIQLQAEEYDLMAAVADLDEIEEVNANCILMGNLQQASTSAGSESRPPMLNKENYVPWSSRLLRYAKSRPNGKLIHISIINGPYVRRMIPEPGDTNREADDQAIQTIIFGLPEDIYAAVDSCESAQEIWLRVQQMMKGSDIGIQEKKAKLFNE
nr:hypothetical protein [Tanacetum cinerariifolium]